MAKKKRSKPKEFDSAKYTESYSPNVGLDVEDIVGPHNLKFEERQKIEKHIRDGSYPKSRFERGEVVFLNKDIIEEEYEYRIPKNSLCWVEQITIMLSEIKEEIQLQTQEEIQAQTQEEVNKTYIYKLNYILLYECPIHDLFHNNLPEYKYQPDY
jgi:hypothetical protein